MMLRHNHIIQIPQATLKLFRVRLGHILWAGFGSVVNYIFLPPAGPVLRLQRAVQAVIRGCGPVGIGEGQGRVRRHHAGPS